MIKVSVIMLIKILFVILKKNENKFVNCCFLIVEVFVLVKLLIIWLFKKNWLFWNLIFCVCVWIVKCWFVFEILNIIGVFLIFWIRWFIFFLEFGNEKLMVVGIGNW